MRISRESHRPDHEAPAPKGDCEQGCGLEHDHGHDNRHLSTVLMHLMMLAFLADRIQLRKMRDLSSLFLTDSRTMSLHEDTGTIPFCLNRPESRRDRLVFRSILQYLPTRLAL